ncbi:MAG: hypothetical protein JW762_08470 [Dehalococcoidales bacterium]|nr:hypothetical protein [Dehalococcoidales bacterium]
MKDERYLEFQRKLTYRAISLTHKNGYERLASSIDAVTDWEGFQEIIAQIDATKWFDERNVLKKIEPSTPHRLGNADLLISIGNQDVYCEVTSPISLQKTFTKKTKNENSVDSNVVNLLKKQPWMSETEAKHTIQNSKVVRNLLDKTRKQLPETYPGILVMNTSKSMIFHFDVKQIAEKLFPSRNQIILLMLWSLERGSMIGTPPFIFLNSNSQFQKTGEDLLKYLCIQPMEIL